MDNLTHSLVGVLIAKAGLERRVPYAVPAAIVAANGPDIDLIASLGGRWSYLAHHRGTSHSIVGVIAISVGIALAFWLIERLIARRRNREPGNNLRGLVLLCLVAGATHPLLDWTNNYGVRPFLPFDGRWYYGDLVFVFDPWIWLVLGGAAFWITATTKGRTLFWAAIGLMLTALLIAGVSLALPNKRAPVETGTVQIWVLGLGAVVGLAKIVGGRIRASTVAIVALCLIPVYWVGLAYLRHRAAEHASPMVEVNAQMYRETVHQIAFMPTFGDPRRWQGLAQTENAVYRINYVPYATYELRVELERVDGPNELLRPVAAAARSDSRAQVFFGFARFPLATVTYGCPEKMVVRYVDLRYTEPATGGEPFSVDVPVNCPVRR